MLKHILPITHVDVNASNLFYLRYAFGTAVDPSASNLYVHYYRYLYRFAIQSNGWSGPLMAYPDDVRGWNPDTLKGSHGNDPVDVFCDDSIKWGIDFPECGLLGACCGFSVKHISALNQRLLSLE